MALRELAERSGIPPRTLTRYESGEREISAAQLLAVADALGISPRRMAATIELMRERERDEH